MYHCHCLLLGCASRAPGHCSWSALRSVLMSVSLGVGVGLATLGPAMCMQQKRFATRKGERIHVWWTGCRVHAQGQWGICMCQWQWRGHACVLCGGEEGACIA